MARNTTLSTNLDSELKKEMTLFCKRRGLKIQSFIEQASLEQLEDEIDLTVYRKRKGEDEVSLAEVMKKIKK